MRLQADHSDGAYAVRVPCLVCGRLTCLADVTIDRDGPAFRAYYCAEHTPSGTVRPCDRSGCTRCHLSART